MGKNKASRAHHTSAYFIRVVCIFIRVVCRSSVKYLIFIMLFASLIINKPGKLDTYIPRGHTFRNVIIFCAAGVVTKTTDRDSLRYTYNGIRRVRQLALGCESN